MNSKTYRVSEALAEEINKRNIQYIKDNDVIVSEAKIVAAIIKVGLKREKKGDIEAELSGEERGN